MKTVIILVLIIGGYFSIKAQDVVKKMSQETCECISKKDLTNLNEDELTMQLGLCMIQAFGNHKKEYETLIGKTVGFDDPEFEELGEKMGLEMINDCPDVMMKIGMNAMGEEEEYQENESVEVSGKITKLEKNQFYTVHFTTSENTNLKLLFLYEIENSNYLLNESNWKNKTITIGYSKLEFFDPRIDEYSNFNVIDYISLD